MILLVVGNLLNIVLDLWLVMGLHMNVQGAALATAIAEYGTFILGLWMVWRVLVMRGFPCSAQECMARQYPHPVGA